MRVVHRYLEKGWYTPENATALLIGTFPSVLIREAFGRVRQTDVDFFYGSMDNNFWKDLEIIYGRSFIYQRTAAAIKEREELLNELGLGLSDCIYACETTGSSMDTALQQVELNTGLIQTLDDHPSIHTLYFTSSSGKVNAETLTLRLLKEGGRSSRMQIVQKSGPRIRKFLFTDRQRQQHPMTSITLISPSPLAEQMAGIRPEQRRAQYAAYLPKLR